MATELQKLSAELSKQVRWAEKHPVLGDAIFENGARMTRGRGVVRTLAAQLLASRPDIAAELDQRLKPTPRPCENCRAMIQAADERCGRCGRFQPHPHHVMRAEVDALMTLPDPGESKVRIPIGSPVVHTPTGTNWTLVYAFDELAVLRNPAGDVWRVPWSEIEPFGSVANQPLPAGTQGAYAGAPAVQTKVQGSTLSKASCARCGAELSAEDFRNRECSECGADLTNPDNVEDDDDISWKAGFFSSQTGMLKLARQVGRSHTPNFFARTSFTRAAGGILRKSAGLVRGRKVKNRKTGAVGYILQSNDLACAVEYDTGHGHITSLEKLADLEAA